MRAGSLLGRVHSGFSVHGEQTVPTDDLQGTERLAHYLTRGPLPVDVVAKVEGGRLRVRTPHPEPGPSRSRASWARLLRPTVPTNRG